MNRAFIFLLRKQFINFIKGFVKTPGKVIPLFLLAVYIIFLVPLTLIDSVERVGYNTPEHFIVLVFISNLFFVIPAYGALLKGTSHYFRSNDINYIFTYPYTPNQVAIYGVFKTSIYSIFLSVFLFLLGYFVFNITLLSCLIYTILGMTLSYSFSFIVTLRTMIDEKFKYSEKIKIGKILQYLVLIISLISLVAFLFLNLKVSDLIKFIQGDIINFIPIIGWSLLIYKIAIYGFSTMTLISFIIYIFIYSILLINTIKYKSTGKFFESSVINTENLEKAQKMAKKGASTKKLKGKSKHFKGLGVTAIIYKLFVEDKRRGSLKIISFLLPVAFVIIYFMFFKDKMPVNRDFGLFIATAISIYLNTLFSGSNILINLELTDKRFYLIPIKSSQKITALLLYITIDKFIKGLLFIIPFIIINRYSIIEILVSLILLFMILMLDQIIGVLLSTGKIKSLSPFISQIIGILIKLVLLLFVASPVILAYIYSNILLVLISPILSTITIYLLFLLSGKQFDKTEFNEKDI